MNTNPVSPKVTVSTVTASVVVIAMHLLGQIAYIAVWPGEVKFALLVIVTAAVTFIAGYLTRDPLRVRLEGGEHRRSQAGAISTGEALLVGILVAVVLLALVALGVFR